MNDPGTTIYYPYIQIQDVNWLKASLLYWNKVIRIVPPGENFSDDNDIRMAVDAGALTEVDWSHKYAEGAEAIFRRLVLPCVDGDDDLPAETAIVQQAISHLGNSIGHVHLWKMTDSLRCHLRERGLLSEHGKWAALAGSLGGLYMLCLSSEISAASKLPLTTDSTAFSECDDFFRLVADATEDAHAGHAEGDSIINRLFRMVGMKNGVSAACPDLLKLNIAVPGPDDLIGIPMSQVLKFASCDERHQTRAEFRQAYTHFCQELGKTRDPNAIKDIITDKRKEVQGAVSNYQKSLLALDLESFGTAMAISCPFVATSLASWIKDWSQMLATACMGIGFSVAGLAWWGQRRRLRRSLPQSPWNYVVQIKRAFPVLKRPI